MPHIANLGYRTAALLLGLHALLVIVNAATYVSWSGDTSGLSFRFFGRIAFVGVLMFELFRAASWARWMTVAFASVFGVLGFVTLWTAHQVGLFNTRPYPLFDYAILAVSSIVLLAAALAAFRRR